MPTLPAAYCPTTIVAIDDDKTLLDLLQLRLGETRQFRSFYSPQQAVKFLTQEYKPVNFLENCIEYTEDDVIEQRALNINIGKIHEAVYNPDRFSQIAVIILDFSMPGMDGEDVARALKSLPFQIILLTGEANYDLATTLFNKGLIKYFIRKDEVNLYSKLEQHIIELETNYFQQQSAIIINAIIKKSEQFNYLPLSCLDDPIFAEYFFNIIKKNQIIEYYLLEISGGFLMVDIDGKLSWLLVKDINDMAALEDLYRDDKKNITPKLAQQIERREILLHWFNHNSISHKQESWQNNLYPAHKISGKADYFCAYVTQPHVTPDIDLKSIESFHEYLLTH